ncbi:hypothetical protein ENUP19_0047G0083 [Entamoeba nuttalli]
MKNIKPNSGSFSKEAAKFNSCAKQFNKKHSSNTVTSLLCAQRLTLLLSSSQPPTIIPTLYEIWDSCLLIALEIETDTTLLNLLMTVITHPLFYENFSSDTSSNMYSLYRDHLKKTLDFVIKGLSRMTFDIVLPSAIYRGTVDSLHTELEKRTCSIDAERPVVVAQSKKKVSIFSRFKKGKDKALVMNVSAEFVPFSVKFFALAYFRFPSFRIKLTQYYTNLFQIKINYSPKKSLLKHFPTLLCWDEFDQKLKPMELEIDLSFLKNEKAFFIMTFREVVSVLEKHTTNKVLQWSTFNGFDVLLETYLKYYNTLDISDPYIHTIDGVIVTSVHPKMINFFMSYEVKRTNFFDPDEVLSTISDLEFFFDKLRNKVLLLKKEFDIKLFCNFIDKIIESENVITIQRILTLLYSYADLFSSRTRQYFFLDYLLDKQFNSLAYFWEENVISLFTQLLLFKGTFAKVKNIENNSLDEVEKKLYEVQESIDGITPLQLDIKIIKKVRRRFEKIRLEKLTHSQKNFIKSSKRLYEYFTEIYNDWQNSGSGVFPNLVFVHSIKEKDEVDVGNLF